jgi:hypothetical protein
MKFYPVPKFPCSDKQLEEFRQFVLLPGNISAFNSQRVFPSGVIPAEGTSPKPWRDNAVIWQPGKGAFEYFVLRGEVNLKLRTVQGDAGIPVTDAEGIGELDGYSMYAIAFYNRRFLQSGGKEFARIPKIAKITLDRSEVQRLNIINPATPVEIEWPVAIPTGDAQWPSTINPKCAFRFNEKNGIEAFDIDEYDRENPLVSGLLSDEELVGAVQAIIQAPMSVSEKAKAIRLVVK